MPTPGDKLSSLFKSLRPDDSHLEASTHEAVREAVQRWPLFKAVQPAKSVTTPILKPEERKNWQSPEKPAPRKRKPAASTPSMSDQLAQGLGRMTAAKPVAKRRIVVEKSLPAVKAPAHEALPEVAPVVRRYDAKAPLLFAAGIAKNKPVKVEPTDFSAPKPPPKAMPGTRAKTQTRAPAPSAVESKTRPTPVIKSDPVLRQKTTVSQRSTPITVEPSQVAVQQPDEDSLLSLFSTVLTPNTTGSLPAPEAEVKIDSTKSVAADLPTEILPPSRSFENEVSPTSEEAVKPVAELREMTAPAATEAPQKRSIVRAKPKRMAPPKTAIELQADIPAEGAIKVAKPIKEVVRESTSAPKSDSLRSLFGRLETPEPTASQPAPKKSSFLGRLGKR